MLTSLSTGECQCTGNYTGESCDLLPTDPPILYTVFGGDCNRLGKDDNCIKVTIYGIGFINSNSLGCKFIISSPQVNE